MTNDEIAKQIIRDLNRRSSTSRPYVLLEYTKKMPADVFWTVFHDHWSGCDNTWPLQVRLLKALRRNHDWIPGPIWLEGENRAFYDSLPEQVTVYRGCSRNRVYALSWTTDRAVAERFAKGHRGITVPDPVVVEAVIPNEAIFGAYADRKESEVVVDFSRRKLRIVTPGKFPLG